MGKSRTGSANKALMVLTFILSTARPKYAIIKLERYNYFANQRRANHDLHANF